MKQKVCKFSKCGKQFEPIKPMQAVCDWVCANGLAIEKREAKALQEKLKPYIKKPSKVTAAHRDSLAWQHKQTQKVFNRMRVLEELEWFKVRGIEPYCVSCQKTRADWCCGHYKTVGSQGNLRYDRNNTFLQCNRYCNMGLSGNIEGNKTTIGYKEGLISRFGVVEGQRIIDYCTNSTLVHKWTREELEGLRRKSSAKCRELENG